MVRVKIFLLLSILSVAGLWAAPFNKSFTFKQPDGTVAVLNGRGDEYYAEFFTQDGYAVVYDKMLRGYAYARVSADGTELLSTGVLVGKADPVALGLKKNEQISRDAAREKARKAREADPNYQDFQQKFEQLQQQNDLREALKKSGAFQTMAPSGPITRHMATILVDFPDEPGTIEAPEVSAYFNDPNYRNYGNNGSVMKYFWDVSNGKLLVTNTVINYVRMPKEKSYYDDPNLSMGEAMGLLVQDVLAVLQTYPDWPQIQEVLSGAGPIYFFYAGTPNGPWSQGLWPNSGGLVNIGDSLSLGTMCHEMGHTVCGFPDLYDYDFDSVGAGGFCIMSGAGGGNPPPPCGPLRVGTGWLSTEEMGSGKITVSTDDSFLYKYTNPTDSGEYYLFEHMKQVGRSVNIPGSGIAIYHVDRSGNRDYQNWQYNNIHSNRYIQIVQADNLWHLNQEDSDKQNSGDVNDLFYYGNTSVGYNNKFSDGTAVSSRWWDGSESGLTIEDFSVHGVRSGLKTMTFTVVESHGVYLNDKMTSAVGIMGLKGQSSGYRNTTATKEAGEPDHAGNPGGASIWWKYAATASGKVKFNTRDTHFSALLAAYTNAPEADAGTAIASSSGQPAEIEFSVEAGKDYYIVVDGFNTGTTTNKGSIVLNWIYSEFDGVTGLSASGNVHNVVLSWDDAGSGAVYEIWRGTQIPAAEGDAVRIGVSATSTFVDLTAVPGKSYVYWVKVGNGKVSSTSFGAGVAAVRTLAAPESLSIKSVGASAVTISWAAVTGATYYQVSRSTLEDGSDINPVSGWVSTLSFTDSSPNVSSNYYWITAAVDAGGTNPGLRSATPLSMVLLASGDINTVIGDVTTSGFTWTTSGDAAWYATNGVMRSGAIENDQSSVLTLSGLTAGTLSFDWDVSSEEYKDPARGDRLLLYVNDSTSTNISGASVWRANALTVTNGMTVKWVYRKDASYKNGKDAGFLRNVRFVPTIIPLSAPVLGGITLQGVGAGFVSGALPSDAEYVTSVLTEAGRNPTAVMSTADAMGLTIAQLASGDNALLFNPEIAVTGMQMDDVGTASSGGFSTMSASPGISAGKQFVLTFAVSNGIDATSAEAMNRLRNSVTAQVEVLWSETLGGTTESVVASQIVFNGNGTAAAIFTAPQSTQSGFFKIRVRNSAAE